MYKIFRVRPQLVPFIESYFQEEGIQFSFFENDTKVKANISGMKFHKYVQRAICCLEQMNNPDPNILVLSKEMICNDKALIKLLRLHHTNTFTILKKDIPMVLDYIENEDTEFWVQPEKIIPDLPFTIDMKCTLVSVEGGIGIRRNKHGIVICKHLLVIQKNHKYIYFPIL